MPGKKTLLFPAGVQRVVSFDFETAAPTRASACALGYCVFDAPSGQLLEERSLFIDPECAFGAWNIRTHHITPDMVQVCPAFPDAVRPFLALMDDATVFVAHNAPFDVDVLAQSCQRYHMEQPRFSVCDTLALARYFLPDSPSHRLPSVAAALGLPAFDHHSAAADARICGLAFFALARRSGSASLDAFVRDACRGAYAYTPRPSAAPPRHDWPEMPEDVLPRSPFYGMECAITGSFDGYSRGDVERLVNQYGGIYVKAVRLSTDILFLGDPSELVTSADGKSIKLQKAEHFNAKGARIAFCTEADFSDMLAECVCLCLRS